MAPDPTGGVRSPAYVREKSDGFSRADPTVLRLRKSLGALKDVTAEQARILEPDYYTSSAFLAMEREEIFRKDWVCVGHVAQTRKPGDYFTLTDARRAAPRDAGRG